MSWKRPDRPSSSESLKWTSARVPPGIGSCRSMTYCAGADRSARSITFTSKSASVRVRPVAASTPGNGLSSMVTSFASAAASTGSGRVSEIAVTGSRPVAPPPGVVAVGADISVAKVAPWPATVTVKRVKGGHGSAGLNCSVRALSQVAAPAWAGARVTNFSGWSSAPPSAGPVSWSKKRVIGSQRRRNFSGTMMAPSGRTTVGVPPAPPSAAAMPGESSAGRTATSAAKIARRRPAFEIDHARATNDSYRAFSCLRPARPR